VTLDQDLIKSEKELAATDPVFDGEVRGKHHYYYLLVQYEDTDAGGIVYHAQYLAFAERSRSAMLRCLGVDQKTLMNNEGKGFIVRRLEIGYERPAVLGTRLSVSTRVISLGGASFKLEQNIRNIKNGLILARLFVDIGFIIFGEKTNPRACRLCGELSTKLAHFLDLKD